MVSSAARPLQDQKTLVTGGSSGIGAATARAFARAGAAIGVNYRSKASAAEELVREIRDQGGEALALKADVSRDDEVRAMFDGLRRGVRAHRHSRRERRDPKGRRDHEHEPGGLARRALWHYPSLTSH